MAEVPQTYKQHPVPQQVFDVEFKLVGGLTLKQFGILAVAGALAYLIFISNLFVLFRIIISGLFLLLGVAFAFAPVQDQPLNEWMVAFFRAIYAPTRRIWAKSLEPAEFLVLEVPKIARTTEPGLSAEESRRRLEIYLSAIHEQKKLSPLDLAEEQYLDSIRTMAQKLVVTEVPAALLPPPLAPAPTPALTLEEVLTAPTTTPAPKYVKAVRIAERPSLASAVNFTEPVYKVQRGQVASYFAARRNVRAGRRLTPLAIAGMLVYAPAREQVLTPELPTAPTLPTVEPIALPSPPAPSAGVAGGPAPLPEITPLPPAPIPPAPVEPLPKPEFLPEPPVAPVTPAAPVPPPPPLPKPAAAKPIALPPAAGPRPKAVAPPQAGENVIAGTVFNPQGGVVSHTLIVVENEKGNVVRAIKTNELGKFAISPLPNGRYAAKVLKTTFSFATMEVELTGEKMQELEIRPR